MTPVVFIGGPLHGELRDVRDPREVIRVAEVQPMLPFFQDESTAPSEVTPEVSTYTPGRVSLFSRGVPIYGHQSLRTSRWEDVEDLTAEAVLSPAALAAWRGRG